MDKIDARNQLVLADLDLARQQAANYKGHGLEDDELLSAAIVGLIEAAGRFDPDLGYKFVSYAVWWVRNEIQAALASLGPVRLPHSLIAQATRARQRQEALEQERLGPVSLEDESGMTPRKFADLFPTIAAHLELDAPTPDDQPLDLEAETQNLKLQHLVQSMLGLLFDRERQVLELRFGFHDGDVRTLEEVAQLLGLSCERIWQIERGAFRRLRR